MSVQQVATKRALVIDDSKVARTKLQQMLADRQLEVDTVASGEDGLAYLQDQTPDVLFLDLMLPGIDGLQTLDAIHSAGINVPPIVICTSASVSSETYMALDGVRSVLIKPYSMDDLEGALTKIGIGRESREGREGAEAESNEQSRLRVVPTPSKGKSKLERPRRDVRPTEAEQPTQRVADGANRGRRSSDRDFAESRHTDNIAPPSTAIVDAPPMASPAIAANGSIQSVDVAIAEVNARLAGLAMTLGSFTELMEQSCDRLRQLEHHSAEALTHEIELPREMMRRLGEEVRYQVERTLPEVLLDPMLIEKLADQVEANRPPFGPDALPSPEDEGPGARLPAIEASPDDRSKNASSKVAKRTSASMVFPFFGGLRDSKQAK